MNYNHVFFEALDSGDLERIEELCKSKNICLVVAPYQFAGAVRESAAEGLYKLFLRYQVPTTVVTNCGTSHYTIRTFAADSAAFGNLPIDLVRQLCVREQEEIQETLKLNINNKRETKVENDSLVAHCLRRNETESHQLAIWLVWNTYRPAVFYEPFLFYPQQKCDADAQRRWKQAIHTILSPLLAYLIPDMVAIVSDYVLEPLQMDKHYLI